MTAHLIKLFVGLDTMAELWDWQQKKAEAKRTAGEPPEFMHVTRNTPKRGAELLEGGSLYWVMKGWTVARQRLVELRPLDVDGVPHCGLVLAPEMFAVTPTAHRPFQGWRYLETKDAPADIGPFTGQSSLPDSLLKELSAHGLI